jgi:LL-diaminopimelate aminotransferase
MMNYPHNPSGQIATRGWLWELCEYCARNSIRLFNDAAYIALAHSDECSSLAEVAVEFPELSWAEAYSASKLIANGTGWRIGAIAGSPDFIGDIARIKGNTDSGFVAPMAAGVLYALLTDTEGITACRVKYGQRIEILISLLRDKGMKLAVWPKAGFFTLWMAPTYAFGERVRNGEEFNNLMIERTGVVGVPFGPYIRYAVCGPVEDMAEDIKKAFEEANVSYN